MSARAKYRLKECSDRGSRHGRTGPKTKPASEVVQNRQAVKPVAQIGLTPAAELILLQRVVADLRLARPSDILALQHVVGNQAVSRLIQTKLTAPPL